MLIGGIVASGLVTLVVAVLALWRREALVRIYPTLNRVLNVALAVAVTFAVGALGRSIRRLLDLSGQAPATPLGDARALIETVQANFINGGVSILLVIVPMSVASFAFRYPAWREEQWRIAPY